MNLAVLAMMSMTLMSCMSVSIGNGGVDKTPSQVKQINEVTSMQPFDVVDIANAFKVVYEQGAAPSVRIEASEQALKEMTVYVKDGELRIRPSVKNPTVSFKNVKVYVTSPEIKRIEMAGSGLFAAEKPITASNDLDIELAGSGNVMLVAATCKDAVFELAGSGIIEIGSLTTDEAKAEIAGSGDVNLGKMDCREFRIQIAGSGNVNCDNITADKVHSEIAGSGNVNLKGTVKEPTQEVMGSGKVNIIAPATIQ